MRTPIEAAARILFALLMLFSIAALGRVVGMASPWFALIASFCVLGVFDVTRPFATIRVPRAIRSLRPWETRKEAYQAIGVPAFGVVLRRTPLRLLNRRVYLRAASHDLRVVQGGNRGKGVGREPGADTSLHSCKGVGGRLKERMSLLPPFPPVKNSGSCTLTGQLAPTLAPDGVWFAVPPCIDALRRARRRLTLFP
jgi:hypothetical protein